LPHSVPRPSSNAVEVICLGVGEGWPCHDRRHSAYLYRFGDTRILVDCGEGLSTAFKAGGFSYDSVDRVLLSHMHSDHVGSFSLFIQGMWLEGRRRPLSVSAPIAGIATLQDLLEITLLFPSLIRFPIRWEPTVPGRRLKTGAVSLTAHSTTHLESLRRSFAEEHPRGAFDCYSFVFEFAGKRVAHTSDIGHVDDLEPLLAGSLDLLVCELSHVRPADLFAKLRGREIGRIVFVHLARDLWEQRPQLRRQARAALGGIPFDIPRDGARFLC
jgi:ribonuclease BN (tRNA processing enzyme)